MNTDTRLNKDDHIFKTLAQLGCFLYDKIKPLGLENQEELKILEYISYISMDCNKAKMDPEHSLFNDLGIWAGLKSDTPTMARKFGAGIKIDFADVLAIGKNYRRAHSRNKEHFLRKGQTKDVGKKFKILSQIGCFLFDKITALSPKDTDELKALKDICRNIVYYYFGNKKFIPSNNSFLEMFFIDLAAYTLLKITEPNKAQEFKEYMQKTYNDVFIAGWDY